VISLDSVSCVSELVQCDLVEVIIVIVSACFANSSRAGSRDARLAAISVCVGLSGDWTNSNVFVDEVLSGKVIEGLTEVSIVLTTVSLLALLDSIQFLGCQSIHDFENADEVSLVLLEGGIIGEDSELLVDALRPARDLIVDDVDLFESILELLEIERGLSDVVVHTDDF